jgi:hypothetical protein
MAKFVNAQQMAKDHPNTFEAPLQKDLDAIKVGSYVKICVEPERFWVKVTARQDDNLTGEINNDLIASDSHGLFCDMTVEFTVDNIYQID